MPTKLIRVDTKCIPILDSWKERKGQSFTEAIMLKAKKDVPKPNVPIPLTAGVTANHDAEYWHRIEKIVNDAHIRFSR